MKQEKLSIFINWKLIPLSLLGCFLLVFSIGAFLYMPIGSSLKCLNAYKTCELNAHYLFRNQFVASFRFSEVLAVSQYTLPGYKSPHHEIRIGLKRSGVISRVIVSGSWNYSTIQAAKDLEAYFKNPKKDKFVIEAKPHIGVLFWLLIILLTGVMFTAAPFLNKKTVQTAP